MSRTILAYLQENYGTQLTSASIAEDLSLSRKTVDAIVTALANPKRGLAERVVVEGVEKKVIQATAAGLTFDPDAVEEEEA